MNRNFSAELKEFLEPFDIHSYRKQEHALQELTKGPHKWNKGRPFIKPPDYVPYEIRISPGFDPDLLTPPTVYVMVSGEVIEGENGKELKYTGELHQFTVLAFKGESIYDLEAVIGDLEKLNPVDTNITGNTITGSLNSANSPPNYIDGMMIVSAMFRERQETRFFDFYR